MVTESGGGAFPTTDWGLLAGVRDSAAEAKLVALDSLIRRYWKPVFVFLRCSGSDVEAAKDLTQAFFAQWIERDVFAQADETKGRFRSFMLSCLKRFVSNARRADHAQKRRPPAGLVSLDELLEVSELPAGPAPGGTPDQGFDRTWASEVVVRVLRSLEAECLRTGKQAHYAIFASRVIKPILEGLAAPSMAELAKQYGMTEKQAANALLTAKRAYQRILHKDIRLYAKSEAEVATEVRELFRILGQT